MLNGLGTGTVTAAYTGSINSNLPVDLASMVARTFYRTRAQETRHIVVRKPNNCVSGGERRDSILLRSSLLIDCKDNKIATTD